MKSILLTDMLDSARMYELLAQYDFDIDVVCNHVIPKETGLENTLSFDEQEKTHMLIDVILSGVADEEKVRNRKALLDAVHMQLDNTFMVLSRSDRYKIAHRFLEAVVMEEGHWPPLRSPIMTLDGHHVKHTVVYVDREDEGRIVQFGYSWRNTNLEVTMRTMLLCVYRRNLKVFGRIRDIVNQVLTPFADYGEMRRTFLFKKNGYITPVVEYKFDKGSTPMLMTKTFFSPKLCENYDFYTRALVDI